MIELTAEPSINTSTFADENGTEVAVSRPNPTYHPLSLDLLAKMNAYWRAANYLSVGQIYLYDNPLLREPLKLSHVKPLVVGH